VGDIRRHPGISNSAVLGLPSGLAWGGNHGDDEGEYSTEEGIKKALSGVVWISSHMHDVLATTHLPRLWSLSLHSDTRWVRLELSQRSSREFFYFAECL
jgi:hypothetical protein